MCVAKPDSDQCGLCISHPPWCVWPSQRVTSGVFVCRLRTMYVEVEACVLVLLLLSAPQLPVAHAHPALVTLVRIISLLDPLIPHSVPSLEDQRLGSRRGEDGLRQLEDHVRHLQRTGTTVQHIIRAVNAGLRHMAPPVRPTWRLCPFFILKK